MLLLCLVHTAVLIASAFASPTPVVAHEKRTTPVHRRGARVERDAVIPLRLALKQNNLDTGYDRVMEVSDPSSPKYGQYLSPQQVHDLFAPSSETLETVKAWLVDFGVDVKHIKHYENKGWLAIDLPADHAERLLSTEYYEHEHDHDGSVRIGCDEYFLPSHVSKHVEFVKPGVKLSAPLRKRTIDRRQSETLSRYGRPPPHVPNRSNPGYDMPPGAANLPADLQNCGVNISIQCYQALYHIPRGYLSDPSNVMGLYESYDAFSAADIALFFKNYAPWVPDDTVPLVISVDGGTAPVAPTSVRDGGESDIDIDISQSLIYPQKVVVYQVDDLPNSSEETEFFNTFLDSIDGSYCNYSAFGITGDSPGIDATYPDDLAGGYKGALECGTYNLTKVVSISYGEAEIDLPKTYVERQCSEFMKLGLQGHSLLVASGDWGVACSPGSNDDEFGCLSGHGQNGTIYNPNYPCGCPYITVVGATQLYPNDTVLDPESSMQMNLTIYGYPAPYAFFASGGGFSNYFTPPKYQVSAVAEYLAQHAPDVKTYVANADASNIGENGGVYNRAGRGYPDVAANGVNLYVYVGEVLNAYDGTSLASPLFGSVLTLINEERIKAGKTSIGFVNPVLYAHPEVLNDITKGSNPNCGSSGFSTAKGWDPVTGLGTPNYPKMLELFLSLP